LLPHLQFQRLQAHEELLLVQIAAVVYVLIWY
jgi:hypothetical protein